MCERMGIRIIAASTPQAKGRVERGNGTHQDRLIKKMRLKKIVSFEQANRYLETEYLPEHNRRFATAPTAPEDYHRKAPRIRELDDVFRLGSGRSATTGWCDTTIASCNWSGKAGIMLQRKPKWWCANGRTAASRFTTANRSWRGRRSMADR
jgi:hypothetical protein